jgi:predicted AlkP superfamily pyrophosphatase or phosphodiesterase
MRKILLVSLCALAALAPSHAQPARRPKLVLAIVVDQFRYDYLTRFQKDYAGGIATLLAHGAVFTNARYTQFPTVTAVGHSVIMTGAPPAMSGIVGNSWYSGEERRLVTSVCDDSYETLGAGRASATVPLSAPLPAGQAVPDCTDASPASPNRLLVDTVGDELRVVSEESKVVGISLKPRSAILPAGHMATGAYWFDESGVFVTSSFYGKQLAPWVSDFNKDAPANAYAGKEWMGTKFGSGADLYRAIPASPWGNELIEAFAETAVDGEKLGKRGVTDVLTISFSSNDYVGHRVGPDAPEVRDMAIRTDKLIDRFFHFLVSRGMSMADVLVVFSSDHGVAPLPEKNRERKMPGNRISPGQISRAVEDALTVRFGAGAWLIDKPVEYVLYLNQDLIREKKLDRAEVDRVAAEALASRPYVFRVYTREQLANGVTGDRIAQACTNGFFASRSGDLFILPDPYWLTGTSGTSHGTPFNYDTHVPVIFMGPGIRPGRYHQNISVTDIAPTLATLLNLEMPSGADGRALAEIISEN